MITIPEERPPGKSVETVNVNAVEEVRGPAPVLQVTPEQERVLREVMLNNLPKLVAGVISPVSVPVVEAVAADPAG